MIRSLPPISKPFSIFALTSVSALALTACGGGGGSSTDGDATTQSIAPVVVAGSDFDMDEDTSAQLDATVTDPDSTPSIRWTQISGPTGSFDDVTVEDPVFRVPFVDEDLEIQLRVTADDGENTPVSDEVTILVNNVRNQDNGPSSQGISGDGDGRREDADRNRSTNRRSFGDFEARSYDGSNNNVDNPSWGQSFIQLQRLSASDYGNGYDSLAGQSRPSAREISNAIFAQSEGTSIPNGFDATDMVWQWGQFIDHDIDLTDGAELSANIPVPSGDPYFDPDGTGTQEIGFNRAIYDPDTGSDASNPRQQENEITSWIDASMVYGSDDERAAALRVSEDSPFLATSSGNLLPFNEAGLSNANGFVVDAGTLFLAGDVRANEQIGLTVMHTLFVREHNRRAAIVAENNPDASADEVFEATRRYVAGLIQKITYEDWLPKLVGDAAVADYSGYDNDLNPSIYNEFSVAAFRLGHSMINDQIWRLDNAGSEIADGHLSLRDAFFSGFMLLTEEDDIDPILRGLSAQSHQSIDNLIIHDLRNMLFGAPGSGGSDLASLNIQRGRDHGISSYNDVREAMGLARVVSFSEITSDADLADALQSSYITVDDIDLWVGGLSEDPAAGSQLGETLQAIIVRQFTELRDGDRFWYERDLPNDMVDSINDTTLADIIRRNTSIGGELQDDVFTTP